jgi:hypothetical protein
VKHRHEFCTVVDEGYLPRAVALHRSLAEAGAPFRLRVLCIDELAHEVLERLALPHLETLALGELERADPSLVEAKSSRSLPEYCWTMKPSLVLHVLAREQELDHVAYVDADHLFWSDPAPVFDALDGGTAVLVPQRINDRAGRFNAGFILFRRSEPTLELLRWWRERCLEWSFAGLGGGNRRFGDQGYLTEWPERFPDVRVTTHPGAGLAPWNSEQHELSRRDGRVLVDGVPLLFYHHQSLRLYEGLRGLQRAGLLSRRFRWNATPVSLVWSIGPWYDFEEPERTLIWTPYVRRIAEAIALIHDVQPDYEAPRVRLSPRELGGEVLRTLAARPAREAVRRAQAVVSSVRAARA